MHELTVEDTGERTDPAPASPSSIEFVLPALRAPPRPALVPRPARSLASRTAPRGASRARQAPSSHARERREQQREEDDASLHAHGDGAAVPGRGGRHRRDRADLPGRPVQPRHLQDRAAGAGCPAPAGLRAAVPGRDDRATPAVGRRAGGRRAGARAADHRARAAAVRPDRPAAEPRRAAAARGRADRTVAVPGARGRRGGLAGRCHRRPDRGRRQTTRRLGCGDPVAAHRAGRRPAATRTSGRNSRPGLGRGGGESLFRLSRGRGRADCHGRFGIDGQRGCGNRQAGAHRRSAGRRRSTSSGPWSTTGSR